MAVATHTDGTGKQEVQVQRCTQGRGSPRSGALKGGGAGGVSPDSPEGNGKARLIRSRPGILP